jgi:hypothetical protein
MFYKYNKYKQKYKNLKYLLYGGGDYIRNQIYLIDDLKLINQNQNQNQKESLDDLIKSIPDDTQNCTGYVYLNYDNKTIEYYLLYNDKNQDDIKDKLIAINLNLNEKEIEKYSTNMTKNSMVNSTVIRMLRKNRQRIAKFIHHKYDDLYTGLLYIMNTFKLLKYINTIIPEFNMYLTKVDCNEDSGKYVLEYCLLSNYYNNNLFDFLKIINSEAKMLDNKLDKIFCKIKNDNDMVQLIKSIDEKLQKKLQSMDLKYCDKVSIDNIYYDIRLQFISHKISKILGDIFKQLVYVYNIKCSDMKLENIVINDNGIIKLIDIDLDLCNSGCMGDICNFQANKQPIIYDDDYKNLYLQLYYIIIFLQSRCLFTDTDTNPRKCIIAKYPLFTKYFEDYFIKQKKISEDFITQITTGISQNKQDKKYFEFLLQNILKAIDISLGGNIGLLGYYYQILDDNYIEIFKQFINIILCYIMNYKFSYIHFEDANTLFIREIRQILDLIIHEPMQESLQVKTEPKLTIKVEPVESINNTRKILEQYALETIIDPNLTQKSLSKTKSSLSSLDYTKSSLGSQNLTLKLESTLEPESTLNPESLQAYVKGNVVPAHIVTA